MEKNKEQPNNKASKGSAENAAQDSSDRVVYLEAKVAKMEAIAHTNETVVVLRDEFGVLRDEVRTLSSDISKLESRLKAWFVLTMAGGITASSSIAFTIARSIS